MDKKEQKELITKTLINSYLNLNSHKMEQKEQWFSGVLKNYIYKNNISLSYGGEFDKKLRHILDYLTSPEAPKKFYSMTFAEAEKQTLKWDQWLQKRIKKGDDPDNTHYLCDLSNDWKAFELTSKKALSYEGSVMQHCVGSYYDDVFNGHSRIISLRDKNNNQHTTIEVRNNKIVQIQGKQNKKPLEKYNKYIFNLLNNQGFSISSHLAKEYNIRQIGHKYFNFISDDDYNNEVFKFLKNNPNYKDGGNIIIQNIDNLEVLQGDWDNVTIIDSVIQKVENLNVKNLEIYYSNLKQVDSIDALNSTIITSQIKNSDTIRSSCAVIKDSFYQTLNLTQTNEVTLENQFIKEAITGDHTLDKVFLNKSAFLDLNSIKSHFLKSKKSNLSIQNSNLQNFKVIDIDIFNNETINEETFSKDTTEIKINSAPNLEEISNIDNSNLSLSINETKKLSSISNNSMNTLNLNHVMNIQSILKNKLNTLQIIIKSDQPIKNRRNRIKKIVTNKVSLFKQKETLKR